MPQFIKNYLMMGVLGVYCIAGNANAEINPSIAACEMVAECAPGCSWNPGECACIGTPKDSSRGGDCYSSIPTK